MRIITIDPGEHIGIVFTEDDKIKGLTLDGDTRNHKLWILLNEYQPDTVIYEQFALRASAASKLVGDKFITCEVIGVIKLYCQLKLIEPICLLPLYKEYCGFSSNPKDPRYKKIEMVGAQKITEHTRDAYRLYSYFNLFKNKINKLNCK
jgi:hypothetical protein